MGPESSVQISAGRFLNATTHSLLKGTLSGVVTKSSYVLSLLFSGDFLTTRRQRMSGFNRRGEEGYFDVLIIESCVRMCS